VTKTLTLIAGSADDVQAQEFYTSEWNDFDSGLPALPRDCPGYEHSLEGFGDLDVVQSAPPQLPQNKFIWLGTRQQLAKLDMATLAAEFPRLLLFSVVRDLCVILDQELTFASHLN